MNKTYRLILVLILTNIFAFSQENYDSKNVSLNVDSNEIRKNEKVKTKKVAKGENKDNLNEPIQMNAEDRLNLLDSIKQLRQRNNSLNIENEKLKNLILKMSTEDYNSGLSSNKSSEKSESTVLKLVISFFRISVKVFFVLVIIIALLLILKRKKYINIKIPFMEDKYPFALRPNKLLVTISKQNPTVNNTIQSSIISNSAPKIKPVIIDAPKTFSNISRKNLKRNNKSKEWYVVGASSIGKSHISSNKPCQDNHYCENWGNGWGFAISCDGAGSAVNSQIGSEYIATKVAMDIFKEWIINTGFIKKNVLPTDELWSSAGKEIFNQIYFELEKHSKTNILDLASLACTIIVIVYSPIGLLVGHIGDGRAGFCNEGGNWKSILTPHKGEEANQTLFITSKSWTTNPNLKVSNVLVPEFRVIREKPIAFTLMSDGCEAHSFDCSKMDKETNKWYDPNVPSHKFFTPLTEQLRTMYANNVSFDESLSEWKKFIEEGTKGLKEEPDDKTLILGVLI